jgi:exodeoxyribonuclease VII large subunit
LAFDSEIRDFYGMANQIPFAFDVPSVSELTAKIKQILERNFTDILVEGEISNVNRSRNGHFYFTVKDDDAQLPCVIWRSIALRIDADLRDGQQVVLGGDLQVYPPHGRYQMIVSLVQQAGLGKLQQKFEELKRKLEQEGLFDDAHKKPIPPFPMRIGVITSSTGAAFQDIRSTFEQRWPVATLVLHHASVQGLNAAGELVEAIRFFASQKNPVDLLIVGRGGGSLEDLWPFNEEVVARELFKCPIPVISAVGHEVDFSISDFVADARAATPTQAVIIATPDINELRFQIEDYTTALETTIQQKIQYYREYIHRLTHSHALLVVQEKLKFHKTRVENLFEKMQGGIRQMLFRDRAEIQQITGRLEAKNPITAIQQYQNHIVSLHERLRNRYERMLSRKSTQLQTQSSALEEINPKAPLERGFTRILQNGNWIRNKANYSKNTSTEIEWKDGRIILQGKK